MDPARTAARFFEELWNERRLELATELVAHDCVTHQLRSAQGEAPSTPRGPAALQEHVRGWLAAVPDLRWRIEATVAEGERVVTWAVATGTHRGPWQGVPPTGREIVIRCVVMHRVVAGRIVEDWVLAESLGFFQQLGLVPSTEALLQRSPAEG